MSARSEDSPDFSEDSLDSKERRRLREFYREERFKCDNLHHLWPTSRGGGSSQYNLFPWSAKNHDAWHWLFLNMTIFEVWSNFNYIYNKIFNLGMNDIKKDWAVVCRLDKGTKKQRWRFYKAKTMFINRKVSVAKVRATWFFCFGSQDSKRSRVALKRMMIFMIFGTNIADLLRDNDLLYPDKLEDCDKTTDSIFHNGNLIDFLKKFPKKGKRNIAFKICFNGGRSIPEFKKKLRRIINT